MITFLIHQLRINTSISCLLTYKADPKVKIAAPSVFTKRVHKLKQCSNVRLYVLCYSTTKWGLGGGEGGRLFERGAYFKFRPMGGRLFKIYGG